MTSATPVTNNDKSPSGGLIPAVLRGLGEPRFEPVERRRKLFIAGAAILIVGVLLLILDLVAVKTGTGLAAWDEPVHNWFVAHRSPGLTHVMKFVSTLASPTAMTAIGVLAAAVWAWIRKELWRPCVLVGAMVLTVVVAFVLKHGVHRLRPPLADMMMGPDTSFSFPSGHTVGITVFLLVFAWLVLSRHATAVRWTAWVVAVVVLVPTVAESRLYLGYHWLTDVTGSMALGVAMLGFIMLVDVWRPLRTRSTPALGRKATQAR